MVVQNEPGIASTGPTLANVFILSGTPALIRVEVLGDDTISGQLNAGQCMGKITVGGKYGKYDDAAVDGRETLVGMLNEPVDARTADGDAQGLLVVGYVAVDHAKLIDIDAAGIVDVGDKFVFVT